MAALIAQFPALRSIAANTACSPGSKIMEDNFKAQKDKEPETCWIYRQPVHFLTRAESPLQIRLSGVTLKTSD
jgi:hypothetical protein